MNNTAQTQYVHFNGETSVAATLRRDLKAWNRGLLISVCAGFMTGLGGFAIAFLAAADLAVVNSNLYTVATGLIGTSFISFGAAAHCLDKANAADKAIRLENCRQHGMEELSDEEVAGFTQGL